MTTDTRPPSRIDPLQREYSRRADPEHFSWQTRQPYFAQSEAELLAGFTLAQHESLLEIGCGEGGNLHHLRGQGRLRVGVDASIEKAHFASQNAGARALCADACHLPFADASFDCVLIRDLLHHVGDRQKVLAEASRVLKAGGRLLLIEPNALSPLIMLQAALIPAERGVRSSTSGRIERELDQAGFVVRDRSAHQPLPIGRVLLHPKLPVTLPVTGLLRSFDAAAARLIPRRLWLYLVFQAVKP